MAYEDIYGEIPQVDSEEPATGSGASYATVAPDASGGTGSIPSAFLSVALNGLSKAVDGYTSKKFPLGFYAQQYDVNADGSVTPREAVTPPTFGGAISKAISNPAAVYVAGAVGLVLLILLIKKR